MKVNLIRIGTAALVVISMAATDSLSSPQPCSALGTAGYIAFSIVASETLSSLQEYSTQKIPSVAGFAVAGPGMDRLEMLTNLLALNANQKDQAKAILDEEETLSKPLAEQLKQATEALATAEKAGAPDAEIDQLARNMANISGEIVAADAKAQSRIYSQLMPEQKQRLEQMPRPFLAPAAPLFPPGPVFFSTSGGHPKN